MGSETTKGHPPSGPHVDAKALLFLFSAALAGVSILAWLYWLLTLAFPRLALADE